MLNHNLFLWLLVTLAGNQVSFFLTVALKVTLARALNPLIMAKKRIMIILYNKVK
jgi:hypothetical protein